MKFIKIHVVFQVYGDVWSPISVGSTSAIIMQRTSLQSVNWVHRWHWDYLLLKVLIATSNIEDTSDGRYWMEEEGKHW